MLYRTTENGAKEIRLTYPEIEARFFAGLVMSRFNRGNDLSIERFYPVEIIDGVSYMKYEALDDSELVHIAIYLRRMEAPCSNWGPTAAEFYGPDGSEAPEEDNEMELLYSIPTGDPDIDYMNRCSAMTMAGLEDYACVAHHRMTFEWSLAQFHDPVIVDLPRETSDEEFAAHTRTIHPPTPNRQ